MIHVTYGGEEVSPRFVVTDVTRPLPTRSPSTDQAPGSDRAVLGGFQLSGGEVSLTVWARARTPEARQDAVREVQRIFSAREERPLAFSDDMGRYYMAVPTGTPAARHHMNGVAVTVTLLLADPVMYGRAVEAVVPSGGSVEIRVGGTYPARPVLSAAAAVRDASTGLWGLRVDGGECLRVATGDDGEHGLSLDCAARECRLDGALTLPTLDSDWLELAPGAHTIENDLGAGACTVTLRERWL